MNFFLSNIKHNYYNKTFVSHDNDTGNNEADVYNKDIQWSWLWRKWMTMTRTIMTKMVLTVITLMTTTQQQWWQQWTKNDNKNNDDDNNDDNEDDKDNDDNNNDKDNDNNDDMDYQCSKAIISKLCHIFIHLSKR